MPAEEWSRATAADGQVFVYRERGKGPLVLLLHGFPDTPHGWEPTAAALTEAGYRTVTPWLRGYHPDTIVDGRGYDPVTVAADPIALLDALGEDSAVLVGHDWGAAICYWTANLHAERLRAIVPIAIPHPSTLPQTPRLAWEGRHFLHHKMPWAERSLRRGDFKGFDKLYRRWAPDWTGPERDESLAHAKRCFADPRCLSAALGYYRAIPLRNPPAAIARVPSITALVVGGTTDIPGEPYRETAALLGPSTEVSIVEGAGHWPHREGEEQFHAALPAFLRRLDSETGA